MNKHRFQAFSFWQCMQAPALVIPNDPITLKTKNMITIQNDKNPIDLIRKNMISTPLIMEKPVKSPIVPPFKDIFIGYRKKSMIYRIPKKNQ